MKFTRKWLFRLVVLVVFLVALIAATDNSQEVALGFLDWRTPEWPLSWWVLTAFVLGVLFGMVVNFLTNAKLRMQARRANRAVAKTAKELDKAKADGAQADDSQQAA